MDVSILQHSRDSSPQQVAVAEVVSTPGMRVSAVDMGRAFSKLGFQGERKGGSRGFYVVRLSADERRARARLLGRDGCLSPPDD